MQAVMTAMLSQSRPVDGDGSVETTVSISGDMPFSPANMSQIVTMLREQAQSNPMIAAEVQDVVQRFRFTEYGGMLLQEMQQRLQGRRNIYDGELLVPDESEPQEAAAATSSVHANEEAEEAAAAEAKEESSQNDGEDVESKIVAEGQGDALEGSQHSRGEDHMDDDEDGDEGEDEDEDEDEDDDETVWEDEEEDDDQLDEESAARSQVLPMLPPEGSDANKSSDPNKAFEESRKLDIFLLSKPSPAYSGPEISGEEVLRAVRKIGRLLTVKMGPDMCKMALSNLAATFLSVS